MGWFVLRLVLYGLGVVGSALLAGRLFAINHILAKLWGISQVIWLLICTILIVMLCDANLGSDPMMGRNAIMTFVAILLAACPIITYLIWGRNGRLKE